MKTNRLFAQRFAPLLLSVGLVVPLAISLPAHADLGDVLVQITGRAPITIINMTQDNGAELKMRMTGRTTFSANDDDIVTTTGSVSLLEKRGGVSRRIDFTQDGRGGIKRTFRVNGTEKPLDAEARKWVAQMLQTLVAETAVDADQRVAKLYASGGANAVLDRIATTRTGHARVRYIEALIKQGALDDKQLARLMTLVRAIDSDYEQRSALSTIIQRQPLTAPQQVSVLGVISSMDSDFEKRSVLSVLAPKLATEAAVNKALRDTLAKFDSDFEQRSVIEALVARNGVTPAMVETALECARNIDSDFELATALKTIIRRTDALTKSQVDAYLTAARKIDSNFELRGALTALIERANMEKPVALEVLKVIDQLDSDFEKRNALVALSKRMPTDREVIDRYRQSARGLNDFERGQAEKALDRLKQ